LQKEMLAEILITLPIADCRLRIEYNVADYWLEK